MARITADEQSSSAGHIAPPSLQNAETTAQNIVISPMGQSEVPLPGQGFISSAVMTQEGNDLILESPDGITLVIEGYFSGATPPDLVSSDGKVLTPALVKSFIQASTEYAEDAVAMNDVTPVGNVAEVTGSATVTHKDGSQETLAKGMAIYEGDVIETDAKGAVNIEFVDESSFAISSSAKMAVDEFAYDTQTHGGENNFSMLRGLFVYTSGLVGREDPDDVKINTPVGSIGIRGTIITGSIPADGSGEAAQISVVEGAIVVHAANGSEQTLSRQFETVEIDGTGRMSNIGVLPVETLSQNFNVLRTVAPTLFSAIEDTAQDAAPAPDEPATPGEPETNSEAAPTDASPTPDIQPEDASPPVLQPDVIQLNLLPETLTSSDLSLAALSPSPDPLRGLPALGAEMPSLSPSSFAPPPGPAPQGLTPPAGEVHYDPTLDAPPAPGPGPATPPPAPANTAPVLTHGSSFSLLEQGVVSGQSHHFDIRGFFADDHDTTLTYTYTLSDPASAISGLTIDGAGLVTIAGAASMVPPTSTVQIYVVATDSAGLSSPSMSITLQAYQATILGTSSNDYSDITQSNKVASMKGGDDEFEVYGSTNVVFAGEGNDVIITSSSGNRIYGDDGADTLTISGGSGNLISGGGGADTLQLGLVSPGATFLAFGGAGNDTFKLLNQDSVLALYNGSSVIDGGSGFDTLEISPDLTTNLNLSSGLLVDIEKIRLFSSTGGEITLDISDLFMNSSKTLFLDVEAADLVTVTNVSGQAALTATGGTMVDPSGTAYNGYSNGDVTLYISTDATPANVSFA